MSEYACGNIYIRPMVFVRAGDRVEEHAHNFDHARYVPKGRVRTQLLATIYGDGSEEAERRGKALEASIRKWRDKPRWQFWSPWFAERGWRKWQKQTRCSGHVVEEAVGDADVEVSIVLIKAFCFHTMIAETDGAIAHCIYGHHTPQGDVVQEYTGWRPAYE